MVEAEKIAKEKRITRRERKLLREGRVLTPKSERGKYLKPMEPVIISKEVIKEQSKEVQNLLNKLNALKDRSSKDGASIRKQLRKLGFKLSQFRK